MGPSIGDDDDGRLYAGRVSATDEDTFARELPNGLWERLRLDPIRAPEHIALAAARTFGPQAARWADDKRARFAVGPPELARMAKKRHASLARFEGAATGVGGVVTMVPDLVALAWIQSRLVFYIAAAYGYDPHDPMRPAEALALRLAKLLGIRSARKLAGRLIPGVAVAFNAVGNERRTRALADRAIRFYGG